MEIFCGCVNQFPRIRKPELESIRVIPLLCRMRMAALRMTVATLSAIHVLWAHKYRTKVRKS